MLWFSWIFHSELFKVYTRGWQHPTPRTQAHGTPFWCWDDHLPGFSQLGLDRPRCRSWDLVGGRISAARNLVGGAGGAGWLGPPWKFVMIFDDFQTWDYVFECFWCVSWWLKRLTRNLDVFVWKNEAKRSLIWKKHMQGHVLLNIWPWKSRELLFLSSQAKFQPSHLAHPAEPPTISTANSAEAKVLAALPRLKLPVP